MTEQRAKEMLQQIAYDGEYPMGSTDAFNMAIKALEEIQQYRALGTVRQVQDFIADWRKYRELGNLEELRVARNKQEEFCEWEYDELEEMWQTDCGVLFAIHDSDREITNYCPCCGKRIKVRCEDDNH